MTTFAPTGEYFLGTATAPGTRGSASIALQPPPGGPGLPGVVDLGEVELGIEGTWDASTGTAPLSRATFESMLAAAQDPEVDAAPVHFGHFDPRFPHLSDGEPAVGWIRPTRITQRPDGRAVLMGRLTDVPASLVPVIRHGYKRRSVEFGTDLVTPSGRRYPAVLSGLGLLGVRAPAVKGLQDLADRYLSAPTMPATVAMQAVVVEDAAGDTPASGGWFPVAATVAGHDGRAYLPPAPTGESIMTQRFTDNRIRELLALSATEDVSAIQAGIAQLPSVQGQPGAQAQPVMPQPPAGYFIPPGYVPAAATAAPGQPAAAAQAAQPGVATLQPVAGQPVFQPVQAPPATATYPPQQPAMYLQPAQQPAQPQQPAAPVAQYPPPMQFAPAPAQPAPVAYPGFPGGQAYPAQYPVPQPAQFAQPQPVAQPPATQPGYYWPPAGQPAQPDPAQQQAQQLGQPQQFAPPAPAAQPGQVAASAGAPVNPAGMVLMSSEAATQINQVLADHTRNRRDVAAWQAFSSGKISAAEYPGVRAQMDTNEAGAMAMLELLAPGRYPVQAYGAAGGAGVNPGQLNDAAYADFERGLLGDRARPAQQQQAGAPAAVGSL